MRMPYPYRAGAHLPPPDPIQLQFDFGDPGTGGVPAAHPAVDGAVDPDRAAPAPAACHGSVPEMVAEDSQLSLF